MSTRMGAYSGFLGFLLERGIMRKSVWVVSVIIAAAVAAGVGLYSQGRNAKLTEMPRAVAFRILLGVGDRAPAKWDGSVTVTPGRVVSIQGWRFAAQDSTDSHSSWKASTRRLTPATAKQTVGVMLDQGIIVAVSDAAARLEVKTAQGNFAFSAGEIPFGQGKPFLDGKVRVDCVPDTLQLTSSTEDQDFPAIAQDGDTVYVSYVEFVHSDRSLEGGDDRTRRRLPPRGVPGRSLEAGGGDNWTRRRLTSTP